MESKSKEVMALLAKKIEAAARDSAIKCVEEAEDDKNRFRRWDQIGFFDRLAHYKSNGPFYKWSIDKSTFAVECNSAKFCLSRNYTDDFKEIAGDKFDLIQTKLNCTISVLHNGFFNILVEESERQRFRVRDVHSTFDYFYFASLYQE